MNRELAPGESLRSWRVGDPQEFEQRMIDDLGKLQRNLAKKARGLRTYLKVENEGQLRDLPLRWEKAFVKTHTSLRKFVRRYNVDEKGVKTPSCFVEDGALVDSTCQADPTALVLAGAYVGRFTKISAECTIGIGAQMADFSSLARGLSLGAGERLKAGKKVNGPESLRRGLVRQSFEDELFGGVASGMEIDLSRLLDTENSGRL